MKIDFNKNNGLIPAIIQDAVTQQVLMLGYMNKEAYDKTINDGKVTFFSRSKNRLWTKGETSGNFLYLKSIHVDCDNDTILIKADPAGPTCHTGQDSCFGDNPVKGFLYKLQKTINQRIDSRAESSYTYRIYNEGINKAAQKVGEEAVETIISAKDDNNELFLNETADLLYHLLILLKVKGVSLKDVEAVLEKRAGKTSR